MRKTEKKNGSPHRDEVPPPARAKVLAINDLDTDIGMLNSGGKLCVYENALSDFCRDAEEREERLRQAARRGNDALCIILLHALKDASADIGAIGLARRAMWLAEAAKNGDLADMREKTDALLQNKRLLIKHIRAALEKSATGGENHVIELSCFCTKAPRAKRAYPNREDA
ncbi:MAG: Hpt domain-containing protein [Clostridiales Family XIII bacterium]|jgi:HPt (histidine-containing phosphotransfer) domain-containing protein|nr:Hpt domain-containing protein [Clostridiales Family XIII bacterium]